VCLVQNVSGTLGEGQRITTFASVTETKDIDNRTDFSVQETGVLTPSSLRTGYLSKGQVGYVIAGMRSTRQARIGDTMYIPTDWPGEELTPLSGYEPARQMLFASVFPVETNELEMLFTVMDKLRLNDSSISVSRDLSSSLGAGLRCGFLGFLHMEVVIQRLRDEFNMNVVMTTPSVPYIIEYESDSKTVEISSVSDWPDVGMRRNWSILEPMVSITLISPREYYGTMVEIIKDRRGEDIQIQYMDDGNVLITSKVPWQEVVCDMNDHVKNGSSGYATFNYSEAGYQKADLAKVEINVNNEPCEPLSFIAHSSKALEQGRKTVERLKEVLARQQFEIVLQAKVNNKVLAKARIAPYRKDVLSKSGKTVGGGDISRKKKLLEKQKEGKARAKMVGKVEISQDAFWTVLQR
jgi:elongation factor 4